MQIGLVALGSALGGLTRWGVTAGMGRLFGTAFPWGTFSVNLAGSLFIGWLMTVLSERFPSGSLLQLRPDDLRLLLAVGFTGSLTTFSTFEYESHSLLRDGDGLTAMTYLFGSLFFGLIAVRLGITLGRYGL